MVELKASSPPMAISAGGWPGAGAGLAGAASSCRAPHHMATSSCIANAPRHRSHMLPCGGPLARLRLQQRPSTSSSTVRRRRRPCNLQRDSKSGCRPNCPLRTANRRDPSTKPDPFSALAALYLHVPGLHQSCSCSACLRRQACHAWNTCSACDL
jgi:hypothetical protein